MEFRPERPEIHRDPKGLELVAEVAYPLPPIIDIKKKPGWPRSESSPLRPPRWNQKCSNLARFLEPSTLTQLKYQAIAALFIIVLNAAVTFVILKIIGMFVPLRMDEKSLQIGDLAVHGEVA